MIKILCATIIAFMSLAIHAQPILSVDKQIHDFGTAYESGNWTCLFTISNTGTDTLRISDIQPECGCTVPEMRKKIIAPGESAAMKVKYKSKGRIGQFSKKIAIYSNANPVIKMIFISGEVKPNQTKAFDIARTESDLLLSKLKVNFDTIHSEEEKQFSIIVYNNSDQTKEVIGYRNLPSWIKPADEKVSIKTKEQKELFFTIQGNKINDFGPQKKYFFILTNDKLNPAKMIGMSGVSAPYFEDPPNSKRKLKKWKLTQPKALFSRTHVNYGTIQSGAQTNDTLLLTNVGGDTLKVLKIATGCACMQLTISQGEIAPGESAVVTIVFDSINRKKRQRKSGYIMLNDPFQKSTNITIDGQVVR